MQAVVEEADCGGGYGVDIRSGGCGAGGKEVVPLVVEAPGERREGWILRLRWSRGWGADGIEVMFLV